MKVKITIQGFLLIKDQKSTYICISYHESHKEIATCNNKQGAKTISQFCWKKCCYFSHTLF